MGGESTSTTAELFMPTIGLHCALPDLPDDHPKAQTGPLLVPDPGSALIGRVHDLADAPAL